MLNVLDLFSGIGGFSLGLERTSGFKTVAFCEIEPFPRKVLAKHWPDVLIYEDIRELTSEKLRQDGIVADVITGGFPCQDISLSGPGTGLAGKRSGLWRELMRAIRLVRPLYVIVENVAALLVRGMGTVLGDMAEGGYDAEWDSFPTCLDLGHRRDRTLIVAYDVCSGLSKRGGTFKNGSNAPRIFTRKRFAGVLASAVPREIWADRPLLGRGISRIPERVGRVRACGNSFRPQIPELIGRAILEAKG